MLTNKTRLYPTLMGEAKIMVEKELDKPLPQKIFVRDKKGITSLVDVQYSWIPSKCVYCGHLGHKASRCLLNGVYKSTNQQDNEATTSPNVEVINEILHLFFRMS
ncbi:unnamed protein product [Cochlearia groenlandica]